MPDVQVIENSADAARVLGSDARLEALRRTGLVDSPPEAAFDRLTEMVRNLLHVPVALVSLVTEDRQFFKSQQGLPPPLSEIRQTPLSHSFCQHVVAAGAPFIVGDARLHPLVCDNPAVTDLAVSAYIGVPLKAPDGQVIGSLCGLDTTPRAWTESALQTLQTLADLVMTEIELRQHIRERDADAVVLRKARDAAEAANHAKDQFLAMLSHELRTPLTPVLMTAAVLETNTALSEPLRRQMAMIRRNVELEVRLIDDLLDVSRIISGKLRLSLQRVDLLELVENACEICRPQFQERGQRLTIRKGAQTPGAATIPMSADPARLQQVLWNLLNNASKFSAQGGAISLEIDLVPEDRARVRVTDDGQGIEPRRLESIFDAFEQGDSQDGQRPLRRAGGLGLGLAISRAIVVLHGGTIRAESAGLGMGAALVVDLPVLSVPASADAADSPPADSHPRAGARVMVVEDHADTAEMLARLLGGRGYTVETADSVEAALEKAAGTDFDLVVSDIGLPDGTGYELLERLRTRLPAVRAIAMSGYGRDEDLERALAAGFAELLVKPVDFDQLEQAVQRNTRPRASSS